MASYDRHSSQEFARISRRLDRYFVSIPMDCPYQLPCTAVFYQALFGPLTDHLMELFLDAGYRRNGNMLYTMHCPDCQGCIPIRIDPSRWRPTRSQRRVRRRNDDLEVRIGPVQMTHESLDLCERFLRTRYPHKHNTAVGYYSGFFLNHIITTLEFQYRLDGRLVGGGIADIGENWMNAVYFYFDPDEAKRGLGNFNIITMIEFCREKQIEHLYLGYYIPTVPAMAYKARFTPHYLRLHGDWRLMEKGDVIPPGILCGESAFGDRQ
ncbi:MAG TPA: arginyltransferase [Desulfofustis sp.]|nr:arginyltransferase [Desulfofustis sp. PB-SRB1]HBH29567.1 arginyltransferase [Desulfofustis sp.]HBH32432.1 arginyltransferase [Desulfofustis sp.]